MTLAGCHQRVSNFMIRNDLLLVLTDRGILLLVSGNDHFHALLQILLVKEAYKKAMEILAQNEGKLHEIAAYLLEKETITGDEFMEILNRKEETKRESAEHELVTE